MFNFCQSNKWAAVLAAFFILMLVCANFLIAQQGDHLGLWVIRDQITSRDKIDDVIDFAVRNGFTDIFVQVRGRGDAYYKSNIVPFTPTINDKKFDPLKYILSKAHPKGLKVHAWVNVFLLWSSDAKPESKRHLLNLHPEWCSIDANGVKDINRTNKDFKTNKTEGVYLSPLVPEVRTYLISVFKELVENYNIDGLHFDYIRYPKSTYDFHSYGRRVYKEKTGVDPILLSISNKSFFSGWEKHNLEYLIDGWNKFRCDAISELVREVKDVITETRKPIFLSAAVKPDPIEAKHSFYQDWVTWIKKSWLDFAILMNYTKSAEQFEDISKKIKQSVPQDKVWMGIAVYNQNRYDAMAKTVLALSNDYTNIVFFSYKTFADQTNYFPTIQKALQFDYK